MTDHDTVPVVCADVGDVGVDAALWLAVEDHEFARMASNPRTPFAYFYRLDAQGRARERQLWLWVMVAEGELTFDEAAALDADGDWSPDERARTALERWRRRQRREASFDRGRTPILNARWLRGEGEKAVSRCARARADLRPCFEKNYAEAEAAHRAVRQAFRDNDDDQLPMTAEARGRRNAAADRRMRTFVTEWLADKEDGGERPVTTKPRLFRDFRAWSEEDGQREAPAPEIEFIDAAVNADILYDAWKAEKRRRRASRSRRDQEDMDDGRFAEGDDFPGQALTPSMTLEDNAPSGFGRAVEIFELAAMEAAHDVAADKVSLPYRQAQGRERGRFIRTLAEYAFHMGYVAMLRDAEHRLMENRALGYHRPGLDDPAPGPDGDDGPVTLAEILTPERVERAWLWRTREAEPRVEDVVEREILPENARLWNVFMELIEQADRATGMIVEFAVLREWPWFLLEKRLRSELAVADRRHAMPEDWLRRRDVCDAVIGYAKLAMSRPSKWDVLRQELRKRIPQWRRDAHRRREWAAGEPGGGAMDAYTVRRPNSTEDSPESPQEQEAT